MNQTIQKLFDRKSVRAYSDEIITPSLAVSTMFLL